MNNCPKCNAPLQEMAQFCPHCMTQLTEKQNIEKPKAKKSAKKSIIISSISVVLVIVIIASSCLFMYNKKHSPICTYDDFTAGIYKVSMNMEINDLWDVNGFIDTHHFEEKDIIQYNTTTNLGDASLSVFFYNKGEEIYAYITDVSEEEFYNAQDILKCITQAVCNHFFSDIDDVFNNEAIYPKRVLEDPFDWFFTDLLIRTDTYNEDIKNGTTITTRYCPMADENDHIIFYYVVERSNEEGTIYDLAVDIERKSNVQ